MVARRQTHDLLSSVNASLALHLDWNHTTEPGQHLKDIIFSNDDPAPFRNWRSSLSFDAMPIVAVAADDDHHDQHAVSPAQVTPCHHLVGQDTPLCLLSLRRQLCAEHVRLMLLRTLEFDPMPLEFLTRLALADALEQQPNMSMRRTISDSTVGPDQKPAAPIAAAPAIPAES
ncbi:hypothetical protein PANT_22d00082 [Moesziomyces antarcticus T-34]|uniref:Uncharacterized protein n=1 Tax=Pseudozyma antarctica (strain T-34) TaxID=1151754 RepID=M9MI05_PSEA3|nr:hypothetical protein PANT_22d00082 [Moesziomyces antarcticus T-34]